MTKKKRQAKSKAKNHSNGKEKHHPRLREELTYGQRASDLIANFGGSWAFIISFGIFLIIWMIINSIMLIKNFDPYPFILLNLVLSSLAAFQAPIILMAQNRQAQRDRIDATYDHATNRKAEREIQLIQKDLSSIRRMVRKMHDRELKHIETKAKLAAKQVIRNLRK